MQVRNENSGKGDMRVKTRQDSTASQGHKLGPARSSKLKPQLCWIILWGHIGEDKTLRHWFLKD